MATNFNELSPQRAIRLRRAGTASSDAARLRLVAAPDAARRRPRPVVAHPLLEPSDPRWVLAIRVAEALEGPILRPEKRQRVLRLGKMLGLSPFDSNLVIAIMQDQARRGVMPQRCPAAGERQLALVPLPDEHRPPSMQSRRRRTQRTLTIAASITTFLAAELFLVWWLFF